MTRTRVQIGLFGVLLIVDQVTKWWIQQPEFHPFKVADGWFNVVRAYNTGVAFSMFNNLPPNWGTNLLVGVTIGIAMAVAFWWWRERRASGLTSWALLLVLAGAVGNIWDRLTLGYVVDFIDWYIRLGGTEYHWPAFNVADSCISVGVVFLLVSSFRKR